MARPRRSEAVVVGAGIAGAAAAYFLSVRHGLRDIIIVEQGQPLSLTSDKSSECYRNWWPGPGSAMVEFTNRSIDLLEELSAASGERFNMNRRGYAFATAEADTVATLRATAAEAERLGSGPAREHARDDGDYRPHPPAGWRGQPTGTDLLLDPGLIARAFPGISARTLAVLHVRRCGWLSAQQLGSYYLEEARAHGARLHRARLTGIETAGGRVAGVVTDGTGGREVIGTSRVVLSPGPGLAAALAMLDVPLPVACECHVKVALRDPHHAMHPHSPLMSWMDPVTLPWSDDERAALDADPDGRALLRPFPAGVHGRPEGGGDQHHALMLWTYDIEPCEPVFPIRWDAQLPEIIVRGMSAMLPAMARYFEPLPRMPVDGGYYTKTPENRPLVGPLPVEGAFVNAAYSGFGIMSSCAGGELLAAHVTGTPLPDYAPALAPARFDDPAYLTAFGNAATAGQL